MIAHRLSLSTLMTLLVLLTLLATAPDGRAATFEYVRGIGGFATDRGTRVTVDTAGNIYLTGSFTGLVDFDPGPGTFNITGGGAQDAFVVKLNSSGNLVWAKRFGGAFDDKATEAAFDTSGNVYITGFFADVADLDPGTGTLFVTSAGATDIFVVKLDSNGNLVWARTAGSTNTDEGAGLAVDTAGNVHVTGAFTGTVDFDPGTGTSNLTSGGAASTDAFLWKLDTNGNLVWARRAGGTGIDKGNAVTVDGSGNVLSTGHFQGTADFDPLNLTSAGTFDVFVLKLDVNGNLTWARAFGGVAIDNGLDLVLDGAGNVYLAGGFANTVDFDPGAGTFILSAAGFDDGFAMKLDANGTFIWARAFRGTNSETALGVAVDGAGNAYLTGSFTGTADFDPGTGTLNLTASGLQDVFAVKLDAGGTLVWARRVGASGGDHGFGVAVEANGSVYLTGDFENNVDFDPGSGTNNLAAIGNEDAFMLKLAQAAPPANAVPGPQTALENTPKIFSTAAGNRISVSDADAGSSPARVTLSASNGTLTLSTTAGLTFSQGDGTGDAAMTFTGTLAAINVALDGLIFLPSPNVTGASSLTITTLDQVGPTGGQVDTDTVSITISPAASACTPRPRVTQSTVATGTSLQVHVQTSPLTGGASNAVQRVTFTRLDNAKVTLNGQPMTQGQTHTAPAGGVFVDFTVQRRNLGQTTTVQYTLVDSCGEWRSFVGGGTGADF